MAIHHDEIAHLAYLNWQKDGCPQGRAQTYWLEAEQQLRATKHLLAVAHEAEANGHQAVVKTKAKKTRKTSARPESARAN